MTGYAELQIRLSPHAAGNYSVELQFNAPNDAADTEPDPGEASFDFDGLDGLLDDPEKYGALLTNNLFADPKVRGPFDQATAVADRGPAPVPLRVRLLIDDDAPELQALRWETLQDPHPRNGTLLTTGERILFSRYLRSPDWRPVRLRARGDLRALVVVSSPANLGAYEPEGVPLQPLDVAGEVALAQSGLGGMQVTVLGKDVPATLSGILDHLRQGYDILYLVCHGALVRERPLLFLEDDARKTAVKTGDELADELGKLWTLPTLVVLASCQSGGSGEKGRLAAAIGPRLARAGVPSVVAMQGKISVEASETFMKRFFVELGRDGQIDRAMAVARSEIKALPGAWMPVLFTRLKGGCLWQTSRPAGVGQAFELWPGLLSDIRRGSCTPILGPGLIEFLLGSAREIARRWADTYRFPMAPYDRENLPQVAQYLATFQGADFPLAELGKYLRREMWQNYGDQLPQTLRDAPLGPLFAEMGRQRRARDETEPHRVLARLPLPIYITTNPDNLLAEALAEAGRDPQPDHRVALYRWKEDVDWPPTIYDFEPDYQPTAARPLVYHLFGQLGTWGSVVLTEDDYFDYLTAITRDQLEKPSPPVILSKVNRALSASTLLFLGFQLDDWRFRVLFHSIIKQEGGFLRRNRPHVAVQIDPEEGRTLDPQGARRYLEKYLQTDNITIYWGTADEFIRELWQQWNDDQQTPAASQPPRRPALTLT